jgi:hypothetical protein
MENHRMKYRDPAAPPAMGEKPVPQDHKIQDEGLLAYGFKHVKRLIVLVIGGTVVLAGIVMLVIPGPGLVVIPIGLGILAIEFAWARRLLRKFKERGLDVKNSISGKRKSNGPDNGRASGSR